MRSLRSPRRRDVARGITVCLCIALGTATTAQPLQTPPGPESCIDFSDAAVRRIIQYGPCMLPLDPAPRWPLYPSREPSGAHPMFWRFPVQPVGPFDAPRHIRR